MFFLCVGTSTIELGETDDEGDVKEVPDKKGKRSPSRGVKKIGDPFAKALKDEFTQQVCPFSFI